MLRFFYSNGSSAVAAHILLEDVGANYEAVEVDISRDEHRKPAFLAQNPKGRIPVLEAPEGRITENPAILEYIAATHPQSGCMPTGEFAQAQARSLCAYLCATAHVAFAHGHRGSRWATEAASIRDMQSQVSGNLAKCARLLEDQLAFGSWALGVDYSYCDPYLFQFGRWLNTSGVALDAYPRLAAHRRAMLDRTATRKVLAVHGMD